MEFNGYYVFTIFNGEERDVRYVRQKCLMATVAGLINGYLYTPINFDDGLCITTTQRNGDAMFTFVPEQIRTVSDKNIH